MSTVADTFTVSVACAVVGTNEIRTYGSTSPAVRVAVVVVTFAVGVAGGGGGEEVRTSDAASLEVGVATVGVTSTTVENSTSREALSPVQTFWPPSALGTSKAKTTTTGVTPTTGEAPSSATLSSRPSPTATNTPTKKLGGWHGGSEHDKPQHVSRKRVSHHQHLETQRGVLVVICKG